MYFQLVEDLPRSPDFEFHAVSDRVRAHGFVDPGELGDDEA